MSKLCEQRLMHTYCSIVYNLLCSAHTIRTHAHIHTYANTHVHTYADPPLVATQACTYIHCFTQEYPCSESHDPQAYAHTYVHSTHGKMIIPDCDVTAITCLLMACMLVIICIKIIE